ncbi:MAG: hypothetical protein R3B70_45715 [Polyangiaceae bacterium]
MVSSFPRDAAVLDLGPHAPVRHGDRHYLLWPAWAYRVVAPEVKSRQLNVLQKAALGLCRAGVGTAERIAEKLCLHVDLAAQICLELQGKALIDGRSLPTQEGLIVLQEETLSEHRLVTGHVFQDPWRGDQLARASSPGSTIRPWRRPGEILEADLGTTGSPRRAAHVHYPQAPSPARRRRVRRRSCEPRRATSGPHETRGAQRKKGATRRPETDPGARSIESR